MPEELFTSLNSILTDCPPRAVLELNLTSHGASSMKVDVVLRAPDRVQELKRFCLTGDPASIGRSFADLVAGPLRPGAEMESLESFGRTMDEVERKHAEEKRSGRAPNAGGPDQEQFRRLWFSGVDAKTAGDFASAAEYFKEAASFGTPSQNEKALSKSRWCEAQASSTKP